MVFKIDLGKTPKDVRLYFIDDRLVSMTEFYIRRQIFKLQQELIEYEKRNEQQVFDDSVNDDATESV